MNKPQLENGYVKIANEIIDALIKIRISGEEMQILWVIIRKTYGWNKKEDKISLSQFSELTGIKKQSVHRAIKKLLEKGVIKKADTAIITYSFNKSYKEWKVSAKKLTVIKKADSVSAKKLKGVSNNDDETVSNNDEYKRHKDTITKDTIKNKEEFVFLQNENFSKTFKDYLDMRKKIKKPATDKAEILALKKLHKYEVLIAIEMLEQSIFNSWQGIFEIKGTNKSSYSNETMYFCTMFKNKYAVDYMPSKFENDFMVDLKEKYGSNETLNLIDIFFEYTNEFTEGREKITIFKSSINDLLIKLSKLKGKN